MNIRSFFILIFGFCLFASIRASHQPEFSTAGFFRISNSGRDVYNTNPAWRLHKGYIEGGTYVLNFDDSNWEVTSLPDGIGTSPVGASSCINYQGEVWFCKSFIPDKTLVGKEVFLHFEAIKGKSLHKWQI